jgi:hypothetical protein
MKLDDLNIHDIGTKLQIAGVIYQGEETAFLALFPGETHPETLHHLDMDLEDWERFIQQTDRVDVMALVKDEHGKVGKAVVRKSARQISQNTSWAVYRRAHYRCRYCGTNDVPLTVDHLVTWEEGGPSTEANLVASCKKCNRMRGNLDYAAWLRHPYYKKVSSGIPPMIQEQNERLVHTLAAIPRHPLKGKRSRR